MFTKVGVIGAGQMGGGIAQICASIGKVSKVFVYDAHPASLSSCLPRISASLERHASKGLLSQAEVGESMKRLHPIEDLAALQDCELIIEAIRENEQAKMQLFQDLSTKVKWAHPDQVIFASNTSSISITKLSAAVSFPSNFIGMHFMNPVPTMKLVEIIPSLVTSPSTLSKIQCFAAHLKKTTTTSQDLPGFIANRVLMPYINEAIWALYEQIGSLADIDATMKLGCHMPMGPLELADFIGLDTVLAILKVLQDGLGDPKYRPCPILVNYVNAGWLGKAMARMSVVAFASSCVRACANCF